MFGFCIDSSRQRTLGGKRFVSASLPEGIADVTSTESRRFRQSPLAKAIYAPRSEHVGLVAREVLLTEISKHHFAIEKGRPAQESNRLPHTDKKPPCDQHCQINQRGLRGPSTCSNKQIVPTFGDETSQDKSTNGSMKPMLTARKKHTHNVALRSIEGALSTCTGAFSIRTR